MSLLKIILKNEFNLSRAFLGHSDRGEILFPFIKQNKLQNILLSQLKQKEKI